MGLKKIKISDIQQGAIRHTTLPDEMIERIKKFKEILGDVEKATLDETIDNFKHDMHPEKEVKIWEHIASVYNAYITEKSITDLAMKEEVFSIILQISMGIKENELQNVKLLDKEQVKNIIYNYNPLTLNDII